MEKICLNPLVSFCVPAHNAQTYLLATLNALCNQNYPNFEIIIVDDHSTDDTATIIKDFENSHIKLINAPNNGAAAARNEALKNSSGDLILFFDADDLIEYDYLSKQVEFWKKQPKNTIILSKWGRFYSSDATDFKIEYEQDNGPMTLKEWVINYWTNNSQMTIPGRVLIPRNIIKKAGGWNEELSLNDDLEFYTRLFSYTECIIINPNTALKYRSGINGLSQQKRDAKKQLAQYNSISLATVNVLSLYPEDKQIELACANMFQAFIYECYPLLPRFIKKSQIKIKQLGGSSVTFQAGGLTKILQYSLGWRFIKRIKSVLGN
jgi:glycosyltransferase involved in cell wall biosynthesis